MTSELEEIKALVDEMAVLWVTQHPESFDNEGKPYREAFEYIRTHPRFNAMIMTAWMSGRWYQESLEVASVDTECCAASREELEAELREELEKEFPPASVIPAGTWVSQDQMGQLRDGWGDDAVAAIDEARKRLASGGIIKSQQGYLIGEN